METSSMWTDAPSRDVSTSLLSTDDAAEDYQLGGLCSDIEPGGLLNPDLNLLARKLGGLRNIGWTVERRVENGHILYQALVYSLRTFRTFPSPWLPTENDAMRAALIECCMVEASDSTQDTNETFKAEGNALRSTSKEGGDLLARSPSSVNIQRNCQHVVVWASYVPEDVKKATAIALYRELLSTPFKLLSVLQLPISSQGILIFTDLASAVDFLRNAKSQQLEFFDSLVAGSWSSKSEGSSSILFDAESGDCIGFSLVNVPPQHPLCVHTLLRLSQHDTVALGHKRSSTETLRLLFTHPEVAPSVISPQHLTSESFTVSRTTPVSQTPSHRRASIWCALCNAQSRDIPGAWKHVSKPPHETIRETRNTWIMSWLMTNYPTLSRELMNPLLEKGTGDRTAKNFGQKLLQLSRDGELSSAPDLRHTAVFEEPLSGPPGLSSHELPQRIHTRETEMYHATGSTPLNPNASPFIPMSKPQHMSLKEPLRQRTLQPPNGQMNRCAQSDSMFDGDLIQLASPTNEFNDPGDTGLASEAQLLADWLSSQGLSPRNQPPYSTKKMSTRSVAKDRDHLIDGMSDLLDRSIQKQMRIPGPGFRNPLGNLGNDLGNHLGHSSW